MGSARIKALFLVAVFNALGMVFVPAFAFLPVAMVLSLSLSASAAHFWQRDSCVTDRL